MAHRYIPITHTVIKPTAQLSTSVVRVQSNLQDFINSQTTDSNPSSFARTPESWHVEVQLS